MRFKATEPRRRIRLFAAAQTGDADRAGTKQPRNRNSFRTTPRLSTTGTPTSSCRPRRSPRRSIDRSADSMSRHGSRSRTGRQHAVPRAGHAALTEADASEQVFTARSCCCRWSLAKVGTVRVPRSRGGRRTRREPRARRVSPADWRTLPDLPDSATIADDYDLQTLLSSVSQVIVDGRLVDHDRRRPGAVLVPEVRDVQDLEANAAAVAAHRPRAAARPGR